MTTTTAFNSFLAADVRTFVFYPTMSCNLECQHCMFASSPAVTRMLDFAIYERAIEGISRVPEWADVTIGFSGGEILVHPRWRDMIETARKAGFKVGIVSNGIAMTRDDVAFLCDLDVEVALSVDGLEPYHDKLRGTGSYARTWESLSALAVAEARLAVNSIVTPTSLKSLPRFVDLLISSFPRIRSINLQNMLPLGRARLDLSQSLDAEGLEILFYTCHELKARHLQTSFNHFLHPREFIRKHPCRVFACSGERCHSGRSNVPTLFNVFPDGRVSPMWALLPKKFLAGDLNYESMETIVRGYIGSKAHKALLSLAATTHQQLMSDTSAGVAVDFAGKLLSKALSRAEDNGEHAEHLIEMHPAEFGRGVADLVLHTLAEYNVNSVITGKHEGGEDEVPSS
jgi:MoaA/NifB/PqqE/SkfB family radical SAM enzyme